MILMIKRLKIDEIIRKRKTVLAQDYQTIVDAYELVLRSIRAFSWIYDIGVKGPI